MLTPGGKAGLNLVDLLLDGSDDFAGVGAVANDDHAADSLLAIFVEHAATELRAELHAGDIADGDRCAVIGGERNVLDVFEAADQADAAHHVLGVADFHHFSADIVVAALDGGNHLLERNVVGAELYRVKVDLVLLDEAADAGDFSDSGHGVELVLDEPVLQGV